MLSDIEIAQKSTMVPIQQIAGKIGLSEEDLIPYGRYIAKVPVEILNRLDSRPDANLILVTAMTPTSMGEGKTTNTIGLGQALSKIGKKTMIAIREPSLGPCMGVKGGAAGGGYSQVLPMEDINLHFTGDLHAVTTAHNLLSSVIDNHLHQKNQPEINPRNIVWKRTIDMNDRALRSIIIGLEDKGLNGVMREDGFDITASSEIMAILCLSGSLKELKEKIGKIIAGYDYLKKPVFVKDIGVQGAMAALLKNALMPNLVQTIEGTPVFVHGGPFANIAHGCNTLIATRMAMKLSDYTVTEAGFGADLGAEKFFDIKCRIGGLSPRAAVLVVTRRAYAIHGIENIRKHAENIQKFNVPVIISINRFADDSMKDIKEIQDKCSDFGTEAVITDFREKGGEGGLEMAEKITKLPDQRNKFRQLYSLEQSIQEKIETIAGEIYGADGIELSGEAKTQIKRIEELGYAGLPVCIAKTQSSFSDNPKLTGRPSGFKITISNARISSGAGFIVVYTGKIMTMPGLPKVPSALNIDVDDSGNISGLF
jgi:formate--tetrahydrofolate ligase